MAISYGCAHADPVDGTWKLNGSSEYFGDKSQLAPLPRDYVQILNGKISVSDTCTAKIAPEKAALSTVFQMLLRQGVRSDQLKDYLVKKYSFDISRVQQIYEVEDAPCTKYMQDLLVDGDRMLIVAGNTVFYHFQRASSPAKTSLAAVEKKQVVTALPFNIAKFASECLPLLPRVRGVPQSTTKCMPLFMPYVASKNDTSTIGKLVGHHHYIKSAPTSGNAYNDPVANGYHPIYVILPALGDGTLVRVEDNEGDAEERDPLAGVYLSIKDGKVVDQLDEGCDFMPDFTCVDDRGTKMYRLLPSGKFSKY